NTNNLKQRQPTNSADSILQFQLRQNIQSTSNPTLEEIARLGAERMLAMALEAEIQAFIEQYSSIKNAQ
ncbi:hypothetical protein CR163_000495, partial [Prosthecochloris sp. ZM_2]|uniref:hypothetical protein n=1 Tax=Prosthecochloris sp. ZM_2 TaxID=2045206 RepID=UPI000E12AFE0